MWRNNKGQWERREAVNMRRTEKNVQMQWLGRGPQESEDKGAGNRKEIQGGVYVVSNNKERGKKGMKRELGSLS